MTALPGWLKPLPAADEMRAADRAAIEGGTPGIDLMEKAGVGLAAVAAEAIGEGRIVILCGKGNNGGDGFVAARELRAAGREVVVVGTAAAEEYSGDAAIALERLGCDLQPFGPGVLERASGAIDALLGTGTTGAPHGIAADAIRALRAADLPVVACDVPSGIDASTGEVEDESLAVSALATATFAAAKPGLWICPAKRFAGRVQVVDIGLPDTVAAGIGLLGDGAVVRCLPGRSPGATKFSAGHVVLAGGSRGMTGAICLAAEAAARAGAGYVTACVPGSLEAIFEVKLTEVMTVALADDDGRLGVAATADVIGQAERRRGALVAGGGLGRGDGQTAFIHALVSASGVPLVLDADGLNALAGDVSRLASRTGATVITPHAGELARLMGTESDEIERRRLYWARRAAEASASIVVLKGDDTLVASPDGRVAVSEGGGAGLATAGTGDVLAGVCGATLAAGLDPFTAACAAVRMHLVAGRLAAGPHGPDGVIASDVVAALPAARAVAAGR